MGYASLEGKAFVVEQLLQLPTRPLSFLDLGAGAGSWLDAVKPWFLESKWIAMEGWGPYIERFELLSRYDLVLPLDIRHAGFPTVAVTIMGDVLEHMSETEAAEVWEKARLSSRLACVISIPIIEYEQGHVHGNPLQEHKSTWSHEKVMDTFEGITASKPGEVVGTYVASWTS